MASGEEEPLRGSELHFYISICPQGQADVSGVAWHCRWWDEGGEAFAKEHTHPLSLTEAGKARDLSSGMERVSWGGDQGLAARTWVSPEGLRAAVGGLPLL